MAKDKSIEEMYQDLIMQGSDMDSYPTSSGRAYDPDDCEDFVTSKEIVEKKIDLEKDDRFAGLAPVPEIEEEVVFKRFGTRRKHKYTEREMKEIRESCVTTIVHDYAEHDVYHMSDEDRRKNDMLADLRLKLGSLKGTYRQLPQYIEAMRVVVQAWAILEQNNFVHTRDEFYQMVADGKIVSNAIIMPKMKGIANYNMDMIIKYISNPEADPKDLVPTKDAAHDPWYDRFTSDFEDDPEYQEILATVSDEYEAKGEDLEDPDVLGRIEQEALDRMERAQMERILTPEEVQYILDHQDHPERMKVHDVKPKMITGYDDRRKGKKKKKLSKSQKYSMESLHGILNKIQSSEIASQSTFSNSYMITHSMFEQDKPGKNPFDEIPFTGSWASKADTKLYDLMLREALMQQHPKGEPYITYADRDLQKFFKTLEDAGVNVVELRRRMNQTDETIQTQNQKHEQKRNKKIEAAIIQRITKLNNDPKFRKTVAKAEDELNNHYDDY
jgi:hypothetical protein